MERNLLYEIKLKYPELGKGQKTIADYLLLMSRRFDKSTVSYISKTIGVSDATLRRFIEAFSYADISDFLDAFYEAAHLRSGEAKNAEDYEYAAKIDVDSIAATQAMMYPEVIENAAEILENARRVYILGIRNCYPLAEILSYYLRIIGIDAVLIRTSDMNEIFEQLLPMQEQDAFVGISFADYSLRTLRAMEYANEKKATIIALTDGKYSPMNMYSACNLWAQVGKISIVDSMTGPLTVLHAVIACLAKRLSTQVQENLKQLEKVWENNDVYGNDSLTRQTEKRMKCDD